MNLTSNCKMDERAKKTSVPFIPFYFNSVGLIFHPLCLCFSAKEKGTLNITESSPNTFLHVI